MYKCTVREAIHYHIQQYQLAQCKYPMDTNRIRIAREFIQYYFPMRNTKLVFMTHTNLSAKRKA